MADVVGRILSSEDFATADDQDTKACEQILDKFLEMSAIDSGNSTSEDIKIKTEEKEDILDTAWEETFGDLFPDLGECTF